MKDADLIDTLYRGADDETAMSVALLAIANRIDAAGVNLRWQAGPQAPPAWVATAGDAFSDAATTQAYLTHWHRHDTHMRLGFRAQAAPPTIFLCHEHMTDRDVARDSYMQEFFVKSGLRYMAGFAGGDRGVAVLGAPRAAGRGPYGPEHRRELADFVPHLQRIAKFAAQLRRTQSNVCDLAAALTIVGTVVAKADAKGRLLDGQDSLAAATQGFTRLEIRKGRLHHTDPKQQSRLLRAIAEAADRSLSAPLTLQDAEPDGRIWELSVAPGLAPAPCALLVLHIKRPGLNAAVSAAAKRFNLSKAEAEIARAIAEGRCVAEIALSRGASEETVRTQLRSVFKKTGVERQAELSALLWRLSMAQTS